VICFNKLWIASTPFCFFSGENLKYYPKNSHLVVVDRNVCIQAYLDSNPGLASSVNIERVIVSPEDNLEVIPDSSIDAVVATFVLCSVMRVNLVLSEIKRILTPVNRN
jgi:ubiquinone/menaquinone biosynthesis C-methylase UbiE